jgi:hypothetical protein
MAECTSVSLSQRRAYWDALRTQGARLGSLVRLDAIAAEVVAELDEIMSAPENLLTLRQASELSGYSVDHLQRLVSSGCIPNVGCRGAPRIRQSDVPRKAPALDDDDGRDDLSDRRRMVRAAITSQ